MALLTVLDIVNTACAMIGEEPVQSLTDDLGGGQSASVLLEAVIDFNLGLQPSGFHFAREVRQLSHLTDAVAYTGFEFVFEVPGEKIGPPVFFTDDPSDPDRRYTRFLLTSGRVHADDNPLYAMVNFRPDPHLWTATFKMATITALSGYLAFAIASDRNTQAQQLQAAYGTPSENFRGGQMRAALSEDGFANPPRRVSVARNPLEASWRG
ncbi:hypothetical protein ACRQ1B_06080 [Rhizobium panacihumi]|uniref:hypothetical protein n=1 Tax=Rhizobium panacihumi TaxID=2008450 RepID=UPI003D78CB28